MKRSVLPFAALAFALACPQGAGAVPVVVLDASNVGIGSLSFSVSGTTITVDETWTSAGIGALLFRGLDANVNYTLVKNILNNSLTAWTAFANELLDPAGQGNDSSDVQPYPSFVPAGYTTSNDTDGLSFAQNGGLPRSATAFSTVTVDELSDVRDFIDFTDGTLGIGESMVVTYGLRDNDAGNQPFLLSQRPNARSVEVPEPASLAVIGMALAGLTWRRRRRQA